MSAKAEPKYYYLILSMYIAGIIGLALPSVRPYFQLFTPFHLLAVAYFLFNEHLKNREIFYYILIISTLGFLIEVLGINTGLVFGEYTYGHTLGIKIAGTPPMIGINWLVMMYCSTIFTLGFIKNHNQKLLIAFVVAALMTAFDIVVEPVAIKLDMWSWKNILPPFQNYAAWFIISGVFAYFSLDLIKEKLNPKAIFILSTQWIFFVLLYFILR